LEISPQRRIFLWVEKWVSFWSRRAVLLAAALVLAVGGSTAQARNLTNPPDAVDDALTTDEDTAGTVNVLGNDVPPPRGAPLSVTGWTNGAHGSVGCSESGECTYTPEAGFSGSDSFGYTIFDGRLGDSATVLVTVNSVNDGPDAVDDALTTNQDTSATVGVLGNDSDPESDPVAVSGSTNGAHGTVGCTAAGACTYAPAAGYSGPDAFTYTISDGKGGSDSASVGVIVNAVAAPPPPPSPPPAAPPEAADVTVTISQEVLAPASAQASAVTTGTRIRYLITVTNNGPGVARDVQLEQQAPSGATFGSVTTDTGSCSGSTRLSCSLGNLTVGKQAHVTTIATLGLGGTALSTATVNATGFDPATANNTASASVEVAVAANQTPPVFGQAANPVVVSGFVCVQLPSSDDCVDVSTLEQIPVGAIVDTRVGRLALTVATAAGTSETVDLYEGVFQLLQPASGTEFKLSGGDFSVCTAKPAKVKVKKAKKKRKPASVEAKPRRPVRRLWGEGKGTFRTSGRYGAASVRGTVWLTEDYCNGTLIKVREGTVTVRDLVKKKTVTVNAGQSYFAEAPVAKAAKAKAKKAPKKKRKPAVRYR
jgi:uncharacterized repeat protein (TIGR01451 family)